ncbi:hypothetical protein HHL22_18805 [Hymenobacter sp. RP-2-7]|uniref:Outer membrane protein beta-barrel domain-containing protein n=1 Tax=Hymenobacter polaris TaxID=2682546 RepID=A0A7Y0FPD3_9BACT|nr:hypothetical protein [Hymenobacter polaris]NML67259.1 hypothetical protein [Hymenobacter polaris]
MTPPNPSPQGSLEELFRHHLLESEAAALPPLPHVWEQLDNSLLLAQNERYRRRLAAYRWAMAASLLLAALAGGGWWRSQAHQPAPTLAAAGPAGSSAVRGAVATSLPGRLAANYGTTASEQAGSATLFSSPNSFSIDQTPTLASFSLAGNSFAPGSANSYATARLVRRRAARAALGANDASAAGFHSLSASGADGLPTAAFAATGELTPAASLDLTDAQAADQLRSRLANVRLPASTTLPAQLRATALAPVAAPRASRAWQLQMAYAAGMFDPNIDFSKAAGEYNANLGPGTVATTREAAAEYRNHLRPGLGQRLSVWATRRLGIGRWNLRTGLEVAQNTASSASSVGFVGEQVATLTSYVQVQSDRLQSTSYRYRSVGVPVELTYTSPMRHGFSLYGRAGTLFSSLLNVHSEVDGDPEATRSYSTRSAGSPYRHLLASVRGGVGMHYEPAGHQWTLSLGPVAEAGITSLNIDPTQRFWSQQRPYSVGLEAGVQFNSLLKPAPAIPAP